MIRTGCILEQRQGPSNFKGGPPIKDTLELRPVYRVQEEVIPNVLARAMGQ